MAKVWNVTIIKVLAFNKTQFSFFFKPSHFIQPSVCKSSFLSVDHYCGWGCMYLISIACCPCFHYNSQNIFRAELLGLFFGGVKRIKICKNNPHAFKTNPWRIGDMKFFFFIWYHLWHCFRKVNVMPVSGILSLFSLIFMYFRLK